MSEPVVVTDGNFESEVLKAEKPVLIDFWAPWCGPCRMVAPIVKELANDYEGKIKVCKLNVDENSVTATKYNIMSIPTLALFKKGEVIETLIGARPKKDIVAFLGKAF